MPTASVHTFCGLTVPWSAANTTTSSRRLFFPGDTIVVPPVIDKRALLQRIVDIATIVGQFGIGIATIALITR